MDQRMRSQRQARETTNRYMKRLAGLTIKEYTPAALSAEARGHLERIEARTIDFAVSRENMQRNRWTRRRRYCRR